jgi:hypothetical protein
VSGSIDCTRWLSELISGSKKDQKRENRDEQGG